MAIFVNSVELIGNLGRDPDVKTFSNGDEIVNLSIATTETWKDKNTGEKKERTEWSNVVLKSAGAARFAKLYAHKGDTVRVVGRLQTRKWTGQDGVEKYTTEVVVSSPQHSFGIVSSKTARAAQHDPETGEVDPLGVVNTGPLNDVVDDEIPF